MATTNQKEEGKFPRWCGLLFTHITHIMGYVGYSKLISGQIAASSGVLVR